MTLSPAKFAKINFVDFVVFVVHFVSHDRPWARTGSQDNLSEAVWRTILRGPRPPGSDAPSIHEAPREVISSSFEAWEGQGSAQRRWSRVFFQRWSEFEERQLEAALLALGEGDPTAVGLKQALTKARIQAQVRPKVQDRVAQTEAFLVRSRKKLESMVEVDKIRLDIKKLEAKIQDGERRLDALHAEAKAQPSPSLSPAILKRRFVNCD